MWGETVTDNEYVEGVMKYTVDSSTQIDKRISIRVRGNTSSTGPKKSYKITMSKPVDMLRSNAGALYMLENGEIRVWDKGVQWRPFEWVSRELTGSSDTSGGGSPDVTPPVGECWSPAAAKVRTRDTEFTLQTPHNDVAYRRKVLDEHAFRLPRVGRHPWFKVRLHGTSPVEFLTLGTSYHTVAMGV